MIELTINRSWRRHGSCNGVVDARFLSFLFATLNFLTLGVLLMGLISADFKNIVEGLISSIKATTDPMQTLGTVGANVRLMGQQYQESKVRNFTLACDEPITSGARIEGQLLSTSLRLRLGSARTLRSLGTRHCTA